MGRLGWSDDAMRRHDDARSREIASRERRKREAAQAREAVEAAWADWNTQEARAAGGQDGCESMVTSACRAARRRSGPPWRA